jgi:hypothetical protein
MLVAISNVFSTFDDVFFGDYVRGVLKFWNFGISNPIAIGSPPAVLLQLVCEPQTIETASI